MKEVNTLSQTDRLFYPVRDKKVSLELAIDAILNASVEEISDTLKKVPQEKTASLVIAIAQVWQDS